MANDRGNSVNDFQYNLDLFIIGASNFSDLRIRIDIDHITSTT